MVSAVLYTVTLVLLISHYVGAYKSGTDYIYRYETSLLIGNHTSVELGFHLEFVLSPLDIKEDLKLMKCTVTDGKFAESLAQKGDTFSSLTKHSFYFLLSSGLVETFYFSPRESITDTNIKKGIAALYQTKKESGRRREVDVLGECESVYEFDGKIYNKIKRNCKKAESVQQRNNEIYGISVNLDASVQYQLSEDVLISAEASDFFESSTNIKPSLGSTATSKQKLTLIDSKVSQQRKFDANTVEDYIENDAKEVFIPSLLQTSPEPEYCTGDACRNIGEIFSKNEESLSDENTATVQSARAFLEMSKAFQTANSYDTSKLLKSSGNINQLMDAAVASNSLVVQQAVLDMLDFTDQYDTDRLERFLTTLSHVINPQPEIMNAILNLADKNIPNEKVKESLLLTAGALIYTFCREEQNCQSQDVFKRYMNVIRSQVKACKEDRCKMMYLSSLGNSGVKHEFVKQLVKIGKPLLSFRAVESVRRVNEKEAQQKIINTLCRILAHRKLDSSTKMAAFNQLLRLESGVFCYKCILDQISSPGQSELKTYIMAALTDRLRHDPSLRKRLQRVLNDKRYNNYMTFAQPGTSAAFTGSLAESDDVNATYSLLMENSPSRLLKRSFFTVDLQKNSNNHPFLKFGLYAEGLESLVDSDSETGVEPTAGMTLEIMGILVRPLQFFQGSGGLMSAAWNAPSELTPALQGSIKIHEHRETIRFSNGLTATLQVDSAISLDLSGSISISLWNRNSESLVRNSGAVWLEGELAFASKYFTGGSKFTGQAATYIDFETDASFYEMPVSSCLRMNRPAFDFLETFEFYQISKKKRSATKFRRTLHINEASYPLHPHNNVQCLAFEEN